MDLGFGEIDDLAHLGQVVAGVAFDLSSVSCFWRASSRPLGSPTIAV
jgi:hypothetical protein